MGCMIFSLAVIGAWVDGPRGMIIGAVAAVVCCALATALNKGTPK